MYFRPLLKGGGGAYPCNLDKMTISVYIRSMIIIEDAGRNWMADRPTATWLTGFSYLSLQYIFRSPHYTKTVNIQRWRCAGGKLDDKCLLLLAFCLILSNGIFSSLLSASSWALGRNRLALLFGDGEQRDVWRKVALQEKTTLLKVPKTSSLKNQR